MSQLLDSKTALLNFQKVLISGINTSAYWLVFQVPQNIHYQSGKVDVHKTKYQLLSQHSTAKDISSRRGID